MLLQRKKGPDVAGPLQVLLSECEWMRLSSERRQRCGDLLYVGPHIRGGTSHIASPIVVAGVGAGNGIPEVALAIEVTWLARRLPRGTADAKLLRMS